MCYFIWTSSKAFDSTRCYDQVHGCEWWSDCGGVTEEQDGDSYECCVVISEKQERRLNTDGLRDVQPPHLLLYDGGDMIWVVVKAGGWLWDSDGDAHISPKLGYREYVGRHSVARTIRQLITRVNALERPISKANLWL